MLCCAIEGYFLTGVYLLLISASFLSPPPPTSLSVPLSPRRSYPTLRSHIHAWLYVSIWNLRTKKERKAHYFSFWNRFNSLNSNHLQLYSLSWKKAWLYSLCVCLVSFDRMPGIGNISFLPTMYFWILINVFNFVLGLQLSLLAIICCL